MNYLELKPGIYWNGVLDTELKVFDIIMETEFGTTYNSYVIRGSEKTALVETAKAKFCDEYIKRVEEITPIYDIDYIIVNHTEPDHAGSAEKLIEMNPNIMVVGTGTAINFLKQIVNHDFYSMPVKEGSTLSLGDKTLQFLTVPNLHWPDTMYTYVAEDKVLFTCDSFGSHYSHAGILRSTVTDEEGYLRATKYYFDNILGPFKNPYMLKALNRIKDFEVEMICPGHGPVLDSHIEELKEIYYKWCSEPAPNAKKTVIIPYVSAYGYTRELAACIEQGIKDSGDIQVECYDLVETDSAVVAGKLPLADGILFGTPTILAEALKPVWDLATGLYPPIFKGKLASAFGSYGWSGEAVPHIIERLKQSKMNVLDGFRIKFKPSENEQTDAYEFGYNFGCVLLKKENDHISSKTHTLVKCLVCGEIFDASLETCPVCGVGPENFVPVEAAYTGYTNPTDEKFVILGGGAAGFHAAKAIRERNVTASIIMVTNEPALPYNRPMLTKSMMVDMNDDALAIESAGWYEDNNVVCLLNTAVTRLDASAKMITVKALSSNKESQFAFDKCICALGSECFIPPVKGHELPEVIAIRRISDAEKIKALLSGRKDSLKDVVVIGGGVLGLEAAWELRKAKLNVTVLEAAPQIMGRQIDEAAAAVLAKQMEKQGIALHTDVQIASIDGAPHVSGVTLADGTHFPAQLVIVSAGIRANVVLAKEAGIEIDRAIIVNEKMETNISDIYAAGDCAQYNGINYALWSEAVDMGYAAGANATGDEILYETVPGVLSFNGLDTSLFALGDTGKNPKLAYKTVELHDDKKGTYKKYYFVNNRLSGAILIGDTSEMSQVMEQVEKHALFKEVVTL
ncbi:MAG: FAD-dependent oxidoreductase [Hespellia sp.]|nr:FAD-dependent oxidoreductase [Hespellia sp.]